MQPGAARILLVEDDRSVAEATQVEKQIAEAEVDLAKQWKYAVHLESSGADTTEVRLLLARLEDAQLRRIQRRNMLRRRPEIRESDSMFNWTVALMDSCRRGHRLCLVNDRRITRSYPV